MIAALASRPVSAGQVCELFCAALLARMVGEVERDAGLFALLAGVSAPDKRKASGSWQSRLHRLDGIDLYCSLVEASVGRIDLLDMGKKGVIWAILEAAL